MIKAYMLNGKKFNTSKARQTKIIGSRYPDHAMLCQVGNLT